MSLLQPLHHLRCGYQRLRVVPGSSRRVHDLPGYRRGQRTTAIGRLASQTHECISGAAYSSSKQRLEDTWDVWVFDQKGQYTEETVSLMDLHTQSSLVARDMLLLTADTSAAARDSRAAGDDDRQRPLIVPKSESLMISLSHVKAVILRDRVILFDVHRPVVQYFGLGLAHYLRELGAPPVCAAMSPYPGCACSSGVWQL